MFFYDFDAKNIDRTDDPKSKALLVFLSCPKIIAWLAENDPQSLKQAQYALTNNLSYESYL